MRTSFRGEPVPAVRVTRWPCARRATATGAHHAWACESLSNRFMRGIRILPMVNFLCVLTNTFLRFSQRTCFPLSSPAICTRLSGYRIRHSLPDSPLTAQVSAGVIAGPSRLLNALCILFQALSHFSSCPPTAGELSECSFLYKKCRGPVRCTDLYTHVPIAGSA